MAWPALARLECSGAAPRQIDGGLEDTRREDVPLHVRELLLDPIQPRGMYSGVKWSLRSDARREPLPRSGSCGPRGCRGITSRVLVVRLQVVITAPRKPTKSLTPMPGRRPAVDLAGLDVQRSLEKRRAVWLPVEPVLLDAARREQPHAVAAVEGLDGGLLINAEHCGVTRWVEVEAAAVGHGRLEVRVVRGQMAREQMGLQVGFAPDAPHDVLVHAQVDGGAAAGPSASS